MTSAGNPVLSTPNGRKLDQALAGLEFMVSIDPYINETTRHAHIILPPSSSLERAHYDVVFHLLAVRNTTKSRLLYFNQTRRPDTTGRFSSNCNHAWKTAVYWSCEAKGHEEILWA